MLPLDGLRLNDTESSGIFSKKYMFYLFNPDTRYVFSVSSFCESGHAVITCVSLTISLECLLFGF